MKKITLLVLLLIYHWGANSQSLPKVIPPSPETSSLFRTIDYPVNHSTGVTDITIPIYEVRSGSISLPISISYNAGGRRVTDETGAVGLGWSLKAGGTIARTVYGEPDELSIFPYEIKSADNLTNYSDYEYLKSINPGLYGTVRDYDTEFDIFSYYFGASSGKFVYNATKDTLFQLPITTNKIHLPSGALFPTTITDEKGTTYNFNYQESYQSSSNGTVTTGLLLSSIISADKKDTIALNYTSYNKTSGAPYQETVVIDDNAIAPHYNNKSNVFTQNQSYYSIPRLSEIKFRGGKVKFGLVSGTGRVGSIQILRADNSIVKTVQFNMSVIDAAVLSSEIDRYKLDQLLFKGSDNSTVEQYSFEYNAGGNHGFSQDWWGYYNGVGGIGGQGYLVPDRSVEIRGYPSGFGYETLGTSSNRDPSTGTIIGVLSGILKKIVYPTGGSTEFEYESNREPLGNYNSRVVGGVRVSQIKNVNENNTVSIRTFVYGENEDGYGTLMLYPEARDMSYETKYYTSMPTYANSTGAWIRPYRKRVYTSDFLPDIATLANEPIYYREVTEYLGTVAQNTGKIIYRYDIPTWPNTNNLGYYTTFNTDPTLSRRLIQEFNLWNSSVLAQKSEFANNGGTYVLKRLTENSFESVVTRRLKGLRSYRFSYFTEDEFSREHEEFAVYELGIPVFAYANYYMNVGYKRLIATSETVYDGGLSVSTLNQYSYNDKNLVSQVSKSQSNGETNFTTYKYPFDYASDATLQQMSGRNMLSYVVEQHSYKGNTGTPPLQSTSTSYNTWNGNNDQLYPQLVETKTASSNYETRLRYHGYDNQGNVNTVSKENGPKISYIYGYKGQHPIAKIENAEYSALVSALGQSNIDYYQNLPTPTDSQINNFIHPLRAALPNAIVTTYTYKPLVGMTSMTDARGQTTTYEYDSFQRLKLVRDHTGNIISKNEYHYKP